MADGLFSAGASGAASGAGQGASVGSLIPGVGTAVGAGVGALVGGISGIAKQKASNQAQEIPLVDPTQRAALADLEQTRKSISSGTDALTQQGIQQQQNIGKSAQTALARSTGGDVGSTMDALLKSQKATQGGVNQTVAQAANRLPYFDSAAGNLRTRIAQRKLELGRLNRDQKVAESAQGRTDANVNTQALLATQGGTQTIPEGVQQLIGAVAGQGGGQAAGGGALQGVIAGAPSQPAIGLPAAGTGQPLLTNPAVGQIPNYQSNIPLGG